MAAIFHSNKSAHNSNLQYFNSLVEGLYKSAFASLGEHRFKDYLITQRRWRYDIEMQKRAFASSVCSLLDNGKSGFCINVRHFDSVPANSKNSDLPRCKDTIQRRLEDKLAQGTAPKAELEKKIPALVNSQCQLLDEHQPFGLQTISDLQCDCERLQNALNSVMHRKATAPKVFFAKFMLPRHTQKN